MKHRTIRDCMFHANDAKKHDVYWSDEAKRWVLENEQVGFIRHFDTLCSALTNMHIETSTVPGYGKEYCSLVPDNWTVTENPYWRGRRIEGTLSLFNKGTYILDSRNAFG